MKTDWSTVALPPGWRLEVMEETDSTNEEARRLSGDAEALVVLAERQTAGRGRRGSAWVSAPGESLTFSVRLRPLEVKALWPRLSLAAGVAVAGALGRVGLEAEIKWPNDVLAGGRKLCGILVEAGHDFVVVGIGINVGTIRFPAALDGNATSVAVELGRSVERGELLSVVLRELAGWTREIGAGFPAVVRKVRERCALTGRAVRLISGDELVRGRVRQIGDAGELVVETEAGVRRFLQADEVRVTG